jgi:hypothetical protein
VPGGGDLRFELPPAALLELTVVSSNGLDVPFDIQSSAEAPALRAPCSHAS